MTHKIVVPALANEVRDRLTFICLKISVTESRAMNRIHAGIRGCREALGSRRQMVTVCFRWSSSSKRNQPSLRDVRLAIQFTGPFALASVKRTCISIFGPCPEFNCFTITLA